MVILRCQPATLFYSMATWPEDGEQAMSPEDASRKHIVLKPTRHETWQSAVWDTGPAPSQRRANALCRSGGHVTS